mgnify:CR=1 FL=1
MCAGARHAVAVSVQLSPCHGAHVHLRRVRVGAVPRPRRGRRVPLSARRMLGVGRASVFSAGCWRAHARPPHRAYHRTQYPQRIHMASVEASISGNRRSQSLVYRCPCRLSRFLRPRGASTRLHAVDQCLTDEHWCVFQAGWELVRCPSSPAVPASGGSQLGTPRDISKHGVPGVQHPRL